MRHILSAEDIHSDELPNLFSLADKFAEGGVVYNTMNGKLLGSLFFEPSTRTRWSTEAAMKRLGGDVLSMEFARESCSSKKGESLRDTLKTCSGYVDILCVRHPVEGAIQDAACYSDVSVINGGDGTNEHPTQALLDLYTITRHFKDLNGLTIMFTGDLVCSRTIHSLTKMLKPYGMTIITEGYASGVESSPGKGVHCVYREQPYEQLPKIDILYMTRHQTEREKPRETSQFVMTNELAHTMKKNAIIMHPLPRTHELPQEVDKNPRAIYFQQAKNGMWVRMALLWLLLTDDGQAHVGEY